ncbi:unnamed protein product [Pocillopora meandrina]|uniref:Uncharacterized protein n=1 Tax=Pocillopora meandrina TaxID=46732 RepID=A0AAU9X4Z5_9CNID|nr:unnamed protein product [Pocillopora meandrina]
MFLIRYFLRKTIYLVLLFLEENLRSKAKQVVDPDSHKIYSRRKEKQGTSSEPDTNSNESVQFPSSGWGTSLEKMAPNESPYF